MYRSLMFVVAAAALVLAGCSKKSSNPVDPGTGNPQPNVTFTMHLESGTQGMIVFASPSVDVKLTKVILSFPAQQFADTLTNPNPQTVYPKDTNIELNEYSGIEGGQQWVLTFIGSVAATNQQFTITVNWTVV